MSGKYSDASWSGYYGLLKLNNDKTALIEVFDNDTIQNKHDAYGDCLTLYRDSLVFTVGSENYYDIWISAISDSKYKSISKTYNNEEWTRPKELTVVEDKLFFFANHPLYGRELFAYSSNNLSKANDLKLNNENIVIFPNPAKNIIFFDIEETAKSVEVYDVLGNKVINQTNCSNKNLKIDILNQGMYLVKINTSIKSYIGKFYKIR